MIMKDESKILPRLLNSIYPLLDYYTVVDTGSTDKSKAIVKQFFGGKKIPGQIYDHKWINYGDARNHALNKAKGKTDFCFTIDADNILKLDAKFDIERFKKELSRCDKGEVEANSNGNIYTKIAFWRNSKPFYYFGATHEVLLCNEPIIEKNLSGISISIKNEGASWKNQKEKFMNNVKLLSDYIDKNGLEPRHVFYLAESYRDAGELEKAIEWYKKRTILGGFYEEKYCAQLEIGKLKWRLGYPIMEVADEFMRCGELDDLRAEHLYELMLMYGRNNRPKGALKIKELLVKYKNPYPQRKLFINSQAYSYNAHNGISATGIWKQEQANYGHIHSLKIADFLSRYLDKDKLVIDAGCGLGFYLNHLKNNGFKKLLGMEGSQLSNFIFDGEIVIQDLTQIMNVAERGTVISLEVGEHIPKEHEQVYLNNITSVCDKTLIISWAVVGQGGLGHVNEQPNEYIMQEIIKRGFRFMPEVTDEIRKLPEDFCWYFRNTLMIFERIEGKGKIGIAQ